jgi:hypothetical protein
MATFCNFVVRRFGGMSEQICINLDKVAYFVKSEKDDATSMVLSVRDEDGEPIFFEVFGDFDEIFKKIKPCHVLNQYDEVWSDADI